MQLVDSHAHIYLKEFKDDLTQIIDRARESGVKAIFMPNIDHTSIDDMLEVAATYPEYCFPMMGLHPCSVDKDFEKWLYEVESYLNKGGFVAVGEIGTDLYWDNKYWPEQQEALKIQLDLAVKYKLPFAIHCRESIKETIELISPLNSNNLNGVFHCFTGTSDQAGVIKNMGFKLGIGGVATFKNGGLNDVIEDCELTHLLLETDSPYLAPAPFRGKRNEPSYITNICTKIAEFKDLDFDIVANQTSENTLSLFNRSHVKQ